MRKFLKQIALFSIPVFIVALTMENIARRVPNPYKYKYEWMQKNADSVEILVFGSSHTFYGVRPDYMEGNVFNLANVSQDKKHDVFLLKYWADRYAKLRTVIMPISYGSWFGKGLDKGIESWRCRFYRIYMDCDLEYPFLSKNNLELSDLGMAKKKIRNYLDGKGDNGCDSLGWGTLYSLSSKNMIAWEDDSKASAAVKRHTVKDWDSIEDNLKIYEAMASFCKKRDIKLIFITTPCWTSYYDKLDRKQLAKMYELTHSFCKRFDVPYFDYFKDERFVADDFYDCDHLSDVGAIKFSQILANDICQIQ